MKTTFSILAILFLAAIMIAFTETKTITGNIVDKKGQPLQGVTVKIKGNNSPSGSVLTDLNGNYTIAVDVNSKFLIFSLAGYKNLEEKIGGRPIINVKMNAEVDSLQVMEVEDSYKRDRASKSFASLPSSAMGSTAQRSFQRYNNNFNTEGYASLNENGFKNVK